MDGFHVAGSIYGDGRLRYPSPRCHVVADLHVLRPAYENRAVRSYAIDLAGAKRAAANEGWTDCVVHDTDPIGVADENRIGERIVDLVALDGDVSILEVVLKPLGAFRGGH